MPGAIREGILHDIRVSDRSKALEIFPKWMIACVSAESTNKKFQVLCAARLATTVQTIKTNLKTWYFNCQEINQLKNYKTKSNIKHT